MKKVICSHFLTPDGIQAAVNGSSFGKDDSHVLSLGVAMAILNKDKSD